MAVPVCGKWVVTPSKDEFVQKINAVSIYEVQKECWRQQSIDYLKYRKLPSDVRYKTEIQRRASFSMLQQDSILTLISWPLVEVLR